MSALLKGLREERNKLVKNSRNLLEKVEGEKRDFNAEENAQWEQMNTEITNLGKRIDRFQKLEETEKAVNALVDHDLDGKGSEIDGKKFGADEPGMKQDEAWNLVLNAWCRAEREDFRPTNKMKQASKQSKFNFRNRKIALPLERDFNNLRRTIMRNAVMSVGTAANGGYTIPVGFVAALEAAMLYFGPMLQVADVMRTLTGNPLHWPMSDDTGNTGVLLTEGTTVGSSVIATLSEAVFGAYKFSSKLVQVNAELMEDSEFDIASLVGGQLGERLGRVGNTYLTTGTGSSQPQGIVTGSTLGVTAADDVTITYDEIIDLEHSVGLAYRPRMAYMCNDKTVQSLRKLKDSQGRYLWQTNANSGQPELLNNRPLHINPDMADMAASAKTVLAGDFSKFKVRMVGQMRARRLSERYADTDQEGFISFMRMDSKVLDAGTHPIKHLAQAAS
ncbi:MAG: phage major capsid protein [Rhizobium sp.]|nr:MAG: phage major capsid protein [Rhizobium sp.]